MTIIAITQEISPCTNKYAILFVNTGTEPLIVLIIPPAWQVITVLLRSLVAMKDIVIPFLSMRNVTDAFPGPPIHCSTIILCGVEQVKVTVVPSTTVRDSGVNVNTSVADDRPVTAKNKSINECCMTAVKNFGDMLL